MTHFRERVWEVSTRPRCLHNSARRRKSTSSTLELLELWLTWSPGRGTVHFQRSGTAERKDLESLGQQVAGRQIDGNPRQRKADRPDASSPLCCLLLAGAGLKLSLVMGLVLPSREKMGDNFTNCCPAFR